MFVIEAIFFYCAIIGSAVMLLQFGMLVIGLGDGSDAADGGDFDGDAGIEHTSISHAADADIQTAASNWLFGVISFRTLVAALAFFGLVGMASLRAKISPELSLAIACASGLGAMYGVYAMMRAIYRIQSDGTVRIKRSVGKQGTVYIPIPGERAGAGKIQMKLQDRIVEYQAMTSHKEKLPTGTRITVVNVLGPDTLEVEPVSNVVETTNKSPESDVGV